MIFTVEEENLICVFDTSNRAALITGIRAALPDCDDLAQNGSAEIREIADSSLRKLEAMSDAGFEELDFSPTYNDEERSV